MNWTGRITFIATIGCLTHLFCVYAYGTFPPGAFSDHGTPVQIDYWDSKRKPLNQMVDITNELGIKILAEHNYLNFNNIAFSPYGLMGILVALFEGVDGEASYQIQRSLQLPWERKVMRIGFRDIHRALKTYFVPEEGFLAGLALNNENVTFTENYKKTLRFYGFDLQNETASTATGTDSTGNETNVLTPATTQAPASITETGEIEEVTTQQSTPSSKEETISYKTEPMTTTISNTGTPANIDVETINTQTESIPTTQSTNDETTITTIVTTSTQTTSSSTTQSRTEESSTLSTTEQITIQTESIQTTTDQTTNTIPESTITTETTKEIAPTTNPAFTSEDITTTTAATSTDSTISNDGSTLETLQRRRKKSILEFIYSDPDTGYSQEYRSFNIGSGTVENDMDIETKFMANGLRHIEVPYMHYDAVLEHAYMPHLEATALRLPLDSDRYYLLIVLPLRADPGEIDLLLTRMARESDLSDIYGALRPRRVRAIVPSFIVKGHVILTTDLQKLGIRDVFEPRQRDFTPMTHQPGVYVRSIEQAVSVAIRKYQPDERKKYVSKRRPVVFKATYPFLYFVVDSHIHVSLMAGKMVDPLNSRIL